MRSGLAVLGGMFDPVHNGHIEAARYALHYLGMNRLKLIPCKNPNHKPGASSGAKHRLAMLNLAVGLDEQIEVDPIEINRSGVSYTVDTLLELRRRENRLVFVLGMDSFNTLPQWHRWSELLELCHFLVLARSGSLVSSETRELLNIERRQVQSPEQLFSCDSGKILFAEDFDFDISSTALRQRLMAQADVSGEINAQVLAYIKTNHLYV